MMVIDVSGCGSGAVFLIKGKANLLFEAGMAYAADQMVENIKRELGDAELDAVLLSHSHYDHVAGLPAVRKACAGGENICFRARKGNFSETGRFEDDPASKRRGGRSGGASMGFRI